jgi:predicted ArsR family transcriptional regulator
VVSKTGGKQSLATGEQRRQDIVRAVTQHWATHDRSPSLRELATAVGVSSKNAVREHVDQLVAQGRLSKDSRGRINPGPGSVELVHS